MTMRVSREEFLGITTQEERREVARNLRETSDDITDWGDSDPFWYVMKCAYGDVLVHDNNELLYRLADLIEPEPERTCKNVACSPCAFRCSDCGWFDKNRCDFNFCPNCGSKVSEKKKPSENAVRIYEDLLKGLNDGN